MGSDTSKIQGDPKALKREDLASLSNLSPAYILKLKERFESSSEEMAIDKQGLQQFFKCRPREIDVLFEMFDLDKSGTIDSYEFVCALSLLSNSTLDEKAELIFNLYDFDRSKQISKDELTVLMTNVLSSLKSMEGQPAPTIADVEKKTNELFTSADINKDNQISLQEFKNYIKKDKQILSCLMSFGVAKTEDLGTTFGQDKNGVPDFDADLAAECQSFDKSQIKQNMKDGIDFKQDNDGLAQGDQFMAVKPWLGTVKNMVPTGFTANKNDGNAPEASLELDYVYGYRCHDSRNNLRYTTSGKILYHTAGVGVVMDSKTNTQRHFMGHNDDVLCLALHPNGKFCATGQIGKQPKLCVWDVDTLEQKFLISAPLMNGIKNVCFSNDGKYLAASAMDDEHFIAVFDWQAPLKPGQALAPIAHGKGSRAILFSLQFNPTGTELVSTGVKEVNFHSFANGVITTKRGSGWGVAVDQGPETVITQAFVGNTLFTGSFTGEICPWTGNTKGKGTKAHASKCNALFSKGQTLISGGADGFIIQWAVQGTVLTKGKQWDINQPSVNSAMPQVVSICQGAQNQLLVGTRGSEIIEFVVDKATYIMQGHYESELWGLACHPTQAKAYTFGRDGMLCVWDCTTKKQISYSKLGIPGDAICISNKGDQIAIGMSNGTFIVLNDQFQPICKKGNRAGVALQVMKYSPNDSILAVGAHDQLVFTYDVTQKYKPMFKLRGNSSTITHLDFSLDSQTLITQSLAYELLFYNLSTGKQVTGGASQNKDEKWASWTCTLGWAVNGIFPPAADGSDINAVCRSPDGIVSATGDDFGMVKLFKYPCPQEKAAFQKYNGHSSHVTNVEFTRSADKTGQKYLISTGGEDKSVFQWKYNCTPISKQAIAPPQKVMTVDIAGFRDNLASGDQAMYDEYDQEEYGEEEEQEQKPKGEFDDELNDEGDQAMATYPAKGQITASTPNGYVYPKTARAPAATLELKWAHGFRSWDTRGNLGYNKNGDVVFTTAGVGVVQNKAQNKQSFFTLHGEDIVSMAIHPNLDIIATGQMAGKGLVGPASNKRNFQGAKGRTQLQEGKLVEIYIWSSVTMQVISKIVGFHRRAVRHLKFSPSGKYLLSIGEDDQNSVAIYDWQQQVPILVASSKISPGKLYDPKSKIDQAVVFDAQWKNDTEFATTGADFVKVFTLTGSNCNAATGRMDSAGFIPQTSCGYVLNGVLLTGASTGDLYKWTGTQAAKPIKNHTDAIWQIVNHTASQFFTGSNDGLIIKWNAQMAAVQTIDLKTLALTAPGLRSICVAQQGNLLVGTRGATVCEIDTTGKLTKTIVQGHYQGVPAFAEVWGCAVHPTLQQFATCGADKCIRLWEPTKMIACSEPFQFDLTACDWSKDGCLLAVGDRKGKAMLLDAKTLKILGEMIAFNAGGKQPWIEDIKISPDNQWVAFGTHDGRSHLEIGKISKTAKGITFAKHASKDLALSSALTHLDWSLDSQTIVLNSQAYELFFVPATSTDPKSKQINASSCKDMAWNTWTCTHGFPVQGIWPGVDYTDVNTCDRSHDGTILATGDDFGRVKLFKYPCTVPKAEFNSYQGHSSHVTEVKFTANDTLLISTGGNDKTVLVWDTSLNNDSEFDKAGLQVQNEEEDQQDIEYDDDLYDRRVDFSRTQKQQAKEQRQLEEQKALEEYKEANEFDDDLQVEADQFMAVKPFKGQIKAPTGYSGKPARNQEKPPTVKVDLDWVHGYRGSNNKNNMSCLKDGNLAYYAAAVGIAYDPVKHQQRFFQKHTDDITCVAFSPCKQFVATGEIGARGVVVTGKMNARGVGEKKKMLTAVYIWDALTMQQKFKLEGNGIEKSIVALGYSPDGSLLGICDQAADGGHNLAIYNANNGICVAKAIGHKGGGASLKRKTGGAEDVEERGKFLAMAFKDNMTFVCIGPGIYKEFTINGMNITGKLGQFGQSSPLIASLAFNKTVALTGAATGELHQWNGTQITGVSSKNHTRLIDAITVTPSYVFTGGRDSKISVLSAINMQLQFQIDCTTFIESVCSQVRAITFDQMMTTMYVGTFGSEIWKMAINIAQKKADKPTVLIQGHYAPLKQDNNEAWGLSIFQNKEQYVTVSDDSTLRIWDSITHKQVTFVDLKLNEKGVLMPVDPVTKETAHAAQGRSIDVSPKGNKIAVGMRDGTLRVYTVAATGVKLTYLKKISKEWIEDLKFSPDGNRLVVGSHDNFLYLFDLKADAMTMKKFGKSSSYITHFDWSLDSQNVRTNDGSYEVLYYNVEAGTQITGGASSLRDEIWATNSCALTWATQGCWQPGQDGSDINHCDRSHGPVVDGMQLVCTADDESKLNIYRYPAPEDGYQALKLTAHSSHVTKCRWSPKDNFIFTLGGNDTTVMQWRVSK